MHIPSLARYSNTSLHWPSVLYTPPFSSGPHVNHPQGYLVGDGPTPSFPAFGSAYNAFFFDDFALSGVGNPQLDVAVHVVDGRARIRRVRIRPASVDVWLGGSALAGTCLELNGAEYRTTLDVRGNRASIRFPKGCHPMRGSAQERSPWLTSAHSVRGVELRSPTSRSIPARPCRGVGKLATRGEGAQLEYKAKLPDTRDEKRNVFKTVVAFANGDGGTIVFGIEDETKTIKGLDGKPSVQRLARRICSATSYVLLPACVSSMAASTDGSSSCCTSSPEAERSTGSSSMGTSPSTTSGETAPRSTRALKNSKRSSRSLANRVRPRPCRGDARGSDTRSGTATPMTSAAVDRASAAPTSEPQHQSRRRALRPSPSLSGIPGTADEARRDPPARRG